MYCYAMSIVVYVPHQKVAKKKKKKKKPGHLVNFGDLVGPETYN